MYCAIFSAFGAEKSHTEYAEVSKTHKKCIYQT